MKILVHPVGPQLVLRRHPEYTCNLMVPLGTLEVVSGVQFTWPLQDPISTLSIPMAHGGRLPIPCRVKMSMYHGVWKQRLHGNVVTFFGYSENRYKIDSLYAHFCTSDRHYMVETKEVCHVVFQELGVQTEE